MGPVGFDLDMTLINSRPAILASFAEVARETGTAIDLDAVDRRLGIKLDDELAFWLPAQEWAAAAEIYRRHYVGLAERMTTALPGAHEALAAVRAAGQRVVIITAKHPISVGPSLRAVGLSADELFTLVHGPEKAAVLRRLKAMAYVGDTPPDMAAAVQAGVRAVGVATGSFSGEDLAGAGADVVLDSLTGFPAWYRSARPVPLGARARASATRHGRCRGCTSSARASWRIRGRSGIRACSQCRQAATSSAPKRAVIPRRNRRASPPSARQVGSHPRSSSSPVSIDQSRSRSAIWPAASMTNA